MPSTVANNFAEMLKEYNPASDTESDSGLTVKKMSELKKKTELPKPSVAKKMKTDHKKKAELTETESESELPVKKSPKKNKKKTDSSSETEADPKMKTESKSKSPKKEIQFETKLSSKTDSTSLFRQIQQIPVCVAHMIEAYGPPTIVGSRYSESNIEWRIEHNGVDYIVCDLHTSGMTPARSMKHDRNLYVFAMPSKTIHKDVSTIAKGIAHKTSSSRCKNCKTYYEEYNPDSESDGDSDSCSDSDSESDSGSDTNSKSGEE